MPVRRVSMWVKKGIINSITLPEFMQTRLRDRLPGETISEIDEMSKEAHVVSKERVDCSQGVPHQRILEMLLSGYSFV